MIIAIGPYIGSIESEIIFFLPYTKWLIKVLKPDQIYISSHKNRRFLYPESVTFFPVFEALTRNEFAQTKAVHNEVSSRDYNIMMKKFKSEVQSHTKSEVFYYNLTYTKHAWIPEYKRVMSPSKCNTIKTSKILFIPCDNEKELILQYVYNKLLESYPDMITACDMHSYLPEHNILLRDPQYFTNVYKAMIDHISSASCVVVPSSHWTTLCDLHGIRCFSWGRYAYPIEHRKLINILYPDDLSPEVITDRMMKWLG